MCFVTLDFYVYWCVRYDIVCWIFTSTGVFGVILSAVVLVCMCRYVLVFVFLSIYIITVYLLFALYIVLSAGVFDDSSDLKHDKHVCDCQHPSTQTLAAILGNMLLCIWPVTVQMVIKSAFKKVLKICGSASLEIRKGVSLEQRTK